MQLSGDRRGQSIQIGAIILFGALIVLLSTYQAFVVPDQNRGVEFRHSQSVQGDMQEVRNTLVSMASGGGSRSVSVELGTNYPSRALFVNPGPPSGTIRTVGTQDKAVNVTIRNASASGDAGDYWDGAPIEYSTGAIVYEPNYNVYDDPPTTVYDNTVLYNQFRDGNTTVSGQNLVDDRTINLVALNGSLSESRTGSASLDIRAASSSTNSVAVTNVSDGRNVTITFPTGLPEDRWKSLLSEQRVRNGGHIYNISAKPLPGTDFARLLTIRFEEEVSYNLRVARAGLGSNVDDSSNGTYLVKTSGDGSTVPEGQSVLLEVEVRDAFNNPVSGVEVEANTSLSAANVTDAATTDTDGTVSLAYDAPANVDGATSDRVNVSLDTDAATLATSVNSSTLENVTFSLTVADSDGSGSNSSTSAPPYTVTWDTNETEGQSGVYCTEDNCTVNIDATNSAALFVSTTPAISGAEIDYSIGTGPASISPSSGETDSTGHNSTTLTEEGASDRDEVTVYATSGGSSDSLPITFETGPFFDVNITESNSPVDQGEILRINGTVENTGSTTDTQDIEFLFDGSVVDQQTGIQLADGATTTFNFTYDTTGENGGSYPVEVRTSGSGSSDSRTVNIVGDVAFFQVSNFQAPSTAYEGETIQVNATVENTGNAAGEQTIEYRFDGTVRDSQTVTLAAGESTTVSFDYTIQETAGTYTHGYYSENDSDTASIAVEEFTPRMFAVANSTLGNNKQIDATFSVSGDQSTYDFDVFLSSQNEQQGWNSKTVTIDGQQFTLTSGAADDIAKNTNERDLLDPSVYSNPDTNLLNTIRNDLNQSSSAPPITNNGDVNLNVEVRD